MGAANYIKQLITKLKKHIGDNIIIVGTLTPHSLKWTDHLSKRLTRKRGLRMTHWTKWTSQIYSEDFILKQQNTHSS